MKRILLASLLGALTFFIWGFVAWTVLHLHDNTIKQLPNGDDFASVAKTHDLKSGVYFYPAEVDADADSLVKEEMEKRHKEGPIMAIFYRQKGAEVMDPMIFLKGFMLYFIITLGICFIVSRVVENLPAYFSRVIFITIIGLLAALATYMSNAVWMYFDLKYTLMMILDMAISWFLVGMVVSLIIKPLHKYSV